MLRHYVELFVRQLGRDRLTSIVRLGALVIGFTSVLLIGLYIADEASWDHLHHRLARLFRVTTEIRDADGAQAIALTSAPIGPAMVARFPEVQGSVRLRRVFRGRPVFRYGDRLYYEKGLFAADADFFQLFDFPLESGDPATALKEPNSIVLTESMARKYFGEERALGKVLTVNQSHDFEVTGVVRDPPPESHLHFDALASFSTLEAMADKHLDGWLFFSEWTYVLLRPEADAAALETKLVPFAKEGFAEDPSAEYRLHLQPVGDIHLRSNVLYDLEPGGSLGNLYALGVVAIVTLLMAVAISTNLSLAQAADRAREVGIRKASGAGRLQLVTQFLFESVLWSILAFALALLVAAALAPRLSGLIGRPLHWRVLWAWSGSPAIALAVLLLAGLLAGFYPAFVVAGFKPATALRRLVMGRSSKVVLRRVLVALQFSVAIGLVAMTILVRRQVRLLENRSLGFEPSGLLTVALPEPLLPRYAGLRDALRAVPGVEDAGAISQAPGEAVAQGPFLPEGASERDDRAASILVVDDHLVQTLGLELAQGRSFSEEFPSDAGDAFVVNQSAAELFGFDRPVGKRLTWDIDPPRSGTIVGVLKDFHYRSLHERIGPLVMVIQPSKFRELLVRLGPNEEQGTLKQLAATWNGLAPDEPFEAEFLGNSLRSLYSPEERIGELGYWFTGLAIALAALGLFGLCGELIRRRRREIGVRKAFGASTPAILRLVVREFALLIALSGLVGLPLAALAARRWLESYPYRVPLSAGPFVEALVLAFLVGIATVVVSSWEAARARPAGALRYE